MDNLYQESSNQLKALLQATKIRSMVHINMVIIFGIILQTILSAVDVICIDPDKIKDLGTYFYYNSNVLTSLFMAPFFIYFVISHLIKERNNEVVSTTTIDININLIIIFVLTFFFQLSVMSDGAFYNFLQGAGLITIATYISGMTRSRRHTIITLLIGCSISLFSLFYHGWEGKYIILVDQQIYDYIKSDELSSHLYEIGAGVTTPPFYLAVVLMESFILFIFIMISTQAVRIARTQIPSIIDGINKNHTEITRLQTIEDTTKEIQKFAMSTKSSFIINNIYIDAILVPSGKCGGDFYDTYSTINGETIFWVGDVAGHGLMPAIIMSLIQASINTYVKANDYAHRSQSMDLKSIYDTLNIIYYDEMLRKFDYNCPVSLVIGKIRHGKLTYIGQHEQFLIKSTKFKSSEKLVMTKNTMILGVPFGIQRDISKLTRTETIDVKEGDELLFFTDGITEATNHSNEMYGINKLIEAFGHSKSINTIIADVDTWSDKSDDDDKTLLHLKVFI